MRIGCLGFRAACALFLLTSVASLPTAAKGASILAFFSGKVTGTQSPNSLPPTVAINDVITNTASDFGYNASAGVGTVNGKTETYNMVNTSPLVSSFQIVVGNGNPNFGDAYESGGPYSIAITDTGTKSATMTITAEGSYKVNNVYATIILTFASTNYTGLALPSTVAEIDTFAATAGSLVWDPNGYAIVGTAKIDTDMVFGSLSVPEPSSAALALIAIGTLGGGFLVSRRKANAANAAG